MFFWRLLFQQNISDIWNFWWIRYLGKDLSHMKNWGVGVNYCWNYVPSKLLLHFIEYLLDYLNSKHTKTSVNSTIQYFEGCSRKKCLLKVWKFLSIHHKMGKFAKLNGNHILMANVFKLHEYKTFCLTKIHNMCKIWFANNIFSLLKSLVYDQRAIENALFQFLPFPFFQISNDYCQKSYNGFRRFSVISTTSQIFLIYTILKMKRRPF